MGPDQPHGDRPENRQGVAAGPCRRSGGAGQPTRAKSLPRARGAHPPAPPLALVLAGLVASAGCQNVAEPATTDQISTTAPTTSATDYPSLYTVPPRPQLTYSVQQRRAIVDGLIADRANARYTDQVVRYRTGRSALPPPPAPPPVVAAVEPEAPAGPPAPGEAASSPPAAAPATEGALNPSGSGEDTLGDFVDQMVRDSGQQEPSVGAGTGAADQGEKSGGSGFFGWLRGLFGQADEASSPSTPASAVAGPPPAAPVAAIDAQTSVDPGPPPEAEAALAALVAATRPAFQPAAGPEPAARFQQAMAPGRADPLQPAAQVQPISQEVAAAADGAPAQTDPGTVGIAIGGGGIAIELGPPALKPARVTAATSTPAAAIGGGGTAIEVGPPTLKPARVTASTSTPAATIAAARNTSGSDNSAAGTPAGRVAFAPGSAELPVGISPQLEQVLATARTRGALIRIVGEADATALALDRARAVAIALVRLGARAGDLDMRLDPHATGDQARLLLAQPVGR